MSIIISLGMAFVLAFVFIIVGCCVLAGDLDDEDERLRGGAGADA